MRESWHELFAVDLATCAFGEMNFHYIAQIKERTRKVIRMGADGVGKPSFARIALNSAAGKGPKWERPATFLMRRPAGLWLSTIIPKLEEEVSKASWVNALGSSKIKDKDKKAGSAPSTETTPTKKLYPAGKPLRLEERDGVCGPNCIDRRV